LKVVGVDPGCSGALALFEDGKLRAVVDMPTLKVRRGKTDKNEVDGYALAAVLRGWAPDAAIVEQVGGIPGQAAGAAFNFGRAAGAVEYILKAQNVRVEMVAPVTWKKRMGVKGDKDDSRAAAIRRWPAHADTFARKKDDGRAEAALIGCYFTLMETPDVLS